MGSLFSKPSVPAYVPPPPIPDQESEDDIKRRQKELMEAQRKKGRRSLFMTSQQGDTSAADTFKAKLLGGS